MPIPVTHAPSVCGPGTDSEYEVRRVSARAVVITESVSGRKNAAPATLESKETPGRASREFRALHFCILRYYNRSRSLDLVRTVYRTVLVQGSQVTCESPPITLIGIPPIISQWSEIESKTKERWFSGYIPAPVC